MIKILDGLWLNSLIGLAIVLLMFLVNVILMKRQTLMVALCNQIFAIVLSYLFGWPCLIYGVVSLIGLCALRYRNRYIKEGSSLDFSNRIFSFNALFNKIQKPKKNEIILGNIMPVNRNELKDNYKPIAVNDTILSGGTLVTGASGSGKTTGLKSVMKQAIHNGKSVVFVDYKGETEILDDLQEYCEALGVPYYEFSSRYCTFSYDPLVNLNETGRVEALMNTRRWDASGADEHYKTSTQLAIQNVIRAYDDYRRKTGDFKNYLVGLRDFTYTYKPELNERDGFNTLAKQLEILLTSRAKDLLSTQGEQFSFERTDQYVVCFSFISANKALANSLSSFIFQDIMDRGTRKHYDPRLLLCIDEFGTLESSTLIKDLLEKGRSGGCQTIFSILDINQISMNAGEYFVNAILGTINSFIIYAGATQKTADLLAGVQKYDNKGYSIMDLRKPYNGKPPTALFISKYPLLSKKGNQEVYRIVPYNYNHKPKTGKMINTETSLRTAKRVSIDKPLLNGEPIDIPTTVTQPTEDNVQITYNSTDEYKKDNYETYEIIDEPTIVDNIDEFL